jgi:predicted acetyltransferase
MSIQLIKPTPLFQTQFEAMVSEFQKANEKQPYSDARGLGSALTDFEKYLQDVKDMSCGIKFTMHNIPMYCYWMVENEHKILGECLIRPTQPEILEYQSGHIGFFIRPSERKKGYGTLMLKMALEKSNKEFDLERVLLTCMSNNLGAIKTIEKCGGKFEMELVSQNPDHRGIKGNRYWVILR